ncbi:uncharacterized protein F4822DRAFT_431976 [Hypoxylon trugodes]|uniref:uncharacterized protein n=1 Tax=Hypoxylon trugodes TaxID=326681 RepID=UPI002198FBF5|nr:uncharacterized protein F4822DRAFT_431976 [Hypoxylon trugodes]KAI1385125.1 hypothetical protein F4822DRAFT_431976 [Hypoxylon trugodes]
MTSGPSPGSGSDSGSGSNPVPLTPAPKVPNPVPSSLGSSPLSNTGSSPSGSTSTQPSSAPTTTNSPTSGQKSDPTTTSAPASGSISAITITPGSAPAPAPAPTPAYTFQPNYSNGTTGVPNETWFSLAICVQPENSDNDGREQIIILNVDHDFDFLVSGPLGREGLTNEKEDQDIHSPIVFHIFNNLERKDDGEHESVVTWRTDYGRLERPPGGRYLSPDILWTIANRHEEEGLGVCEVEVLRAVPNSEQVRDDDDFTWIGNQADCDGGVHIDQTRILEREPFLEEIRARNYRPNHLFESFQIGLLLLLVAILTIGWVLTLAEYGYGWPFSASI